VSVPEALRVQPFSVSKSSKKTVVWVGVLTANTRSSRSLKLPAVHAEALPWYRNCARTAWRPPAGRV
jgi:hypothetical protein